MRERILLDEGQLWMRYTGVLVICTFLGVLEGKIELQQILKRMKNLIP